MPPPYNQAMIIGDDKFRDLDANYPAMGCLLRVLIVGSALAIVVGIVIFIVFSWFVGHAEFSGFG